MFSYNVGPEGADFSQAYPGIQKTYMARFTEYLEKIYRKSQFGLILPDGRLLIAHLAAETTRLERALTPFESDDLNDLSLETDNADENSIDGIRPMPVEKAGIPQSSITTETTRVPQKKQSVKQKSAGKTAQAIEGM
jgi:hypothetical protein